MAVQLSLDKIFYIVSFEDSTESNAFIKLPTDLYFKENVLSLTFSKTHLKDLKIFLLVILMTFDSSIWHQKFLFLIMI